MEIPYERISPKVLRAIVEEFVTREGTDYGHHEFTLLQKVERIEQQLEQGSVKIVFNPDDETCSIVSCN